MQENPLEKQNTRIDVLRKNTRIRLGQLFDDKEDFKNILDKLINQLEYLERKGMVFNKDEIIEGLRKSVEIKGREAFIDSAVEVLEPITILQITQPKIFNKTLRENALSEEENIKLSEVLFLRKDKLTEENEEIFVHLTPAVEFMTKSKIEGFKQEVKKGLNKLAEILKQYPNIKRILASSWLIATPRGRKRIEDLGFTYIGLVSEEENDASYFDAKGERKPFAKAFMAREDFLARYS